jgi:putative RecB family exonuclease
MPEKEEDKSKENQVKKIYSYSRLNTFEQCQLKFKLRYIDNVVPEIKESIESHLGRMVHETLEWLYKQIQENRIPKINEVIEYYSSSWKENYSEDIVLVNGNLEKYFNKGITFIVNYYLKHQPFDENTLEVEKKIIFALDESNEYHIQGYIDRLVHNTETDEIEIHDYKTGNYLPHQEKIDKDRQLALYAIAMKELFGAEKEISLVWHYLAHNKKLISKRTNKQLQKLKEETLELIKKIESTKEFPANKSRLCDWCEYKSICTGF